jgi:cytochrome oxidase Cu insertion factor (SCO1/SenC/PrrC family)
MHGPRATAAAAICVVLATGAAAHETHELGEPPPTSALFEPPAAGSYELPAIRRVRQHELVGSNGEAAPLLELAAGQVAVISFIYRSCADAGGCPAALGLLKKLDRELAEAPELAARSQLVTVSFDPARDTPAKMAELRELLEPQGRWRFLTGASRAQIAPVLVDFDQDVLVVATEDGEAPVFAHLLKLYLVDSDGAVRNIYSASLLDWRLLIADVRTVLGVPEP